MMNSYSKSGTGFDGTVSPDLQQYADRVIWLEDHWDDIKK